VTQSSPSNGQVRDALDVFRDTLTQMRSRPIVDAKTLMRLMQKNSGGTLRRNRQEDAHEALRVLLESLQRACLTRLGKSPDCVDPLYAEKTLIHKVFGGRLTCETVCPRCGHTSQRHESFLDLSLEIRKPCASVSDALRRFQAKETLDKDNLWLCDGCGVKVAATRRLVVSRTPPVLVVHLKRFSMRMDGARKKLTDPIDLEGGRLVVSGDAFELSAVVIHTGWSVHGGHYHALCRVDAGSWLEYDDDVVHGIKQARVLRELQGYILVYSKQQAHRLAPVAANGASSPAGAEAAPIAVPLAVKAAPPAVKAVPPAVEATSPPAAAAAPSPSSAVSTARRPRRSSLLRLLSSSKLNVFAPRPARSPRYRWPAGSPRPSPRPGLLWTLLGRVVGASPVAAAPAVPEAPAPANGHASFSFEAPEPKAHKHRYSDAYDAWDAALDSGRKRKRAFDN